MFYYLTLRNTINGGILLDSSNKYKENRKDECKKFYVEYSTYCLSVYQDKILEDWKVGRYRLRLLTESHEEDLFF